MLASCVVKRVPSWVPGATFQRKARDWQIIARNYLDGCFDFGKELLVRDAMNAVSTGRAWLAGKKEDLQKVSAARPYIP